MQCIRTSASEYWLAEHTGNNNCPICRKKQTMNHITREELITLLTAVPEKTLFQLGTPPAGAERTLSLQVFTQLPPNDAERIQQVARQLPSLAPEAIGDTPNPINPPLSAEELETIEALRTSKAKVVITTSDQIAAFKAARRAVIEEDMDRWEVKFGIPKS